MEGRPRSTSIVHRQAERGFESWGIRERADEVMVYDDADTVVAAKWVSTLLFVVILLSPIHISTPYLPIDSFDLSNQLHSNWNLPAKSTR